MLSAKAASKAKGEHTGDAGLPAADYRKSSKIQIENKKVVSDF
jgi:hypothetical protein